MTVTSRDFSAQRAADAMLFALGGRTVSVRVPMDVQLDNADLGLASPVFNDVEIFPAVVRALARKDPARPRFEVLLSQTSVGRLVAQADAGSAEDFFQAALGLVIDGELCRIEAVASDTVAGAPYLYHLIVSR